MTTNGQHPGGRDLLSQCLIESNLDGVLAVDCGYRCTVWNPAMERISGVSAEHAIGRRAQDVFPFMLDAGEDRHLSDALAGAVVVSRDRPFVVPATGRHGYLEGHYSPLRDSSGAIVGGLGIIRDITARKAVENEYARMKAELADVQMLGAAGRVARNVAHDFNNFFTVILGNVELLLPIVDRLDDEAKDTLLQGLNTVQVASHRAAMLAKHFGPVPGSKAARSELGDVVRGMERLLRSVAREDVELTIRVDPGKSYVGIDPGSLEQLVLCLFVEAREAMPHSGGLSVECGSKELERGEAVTEGVEHAGRYATLTIGGTSECAETAVLRPRSEGRLRDAAPGLATAHDVVERAGGTMAVERQGGGVRFRVYLPAGSEREVATPKHSIDAAGEKVILVCDDQDSVRQVTCEILRRSGYTVLESSSARAALEAAAALERETDLLITDVVMPGMNGQELAAEMAKLQPSARLLYLSGRAREELDEPFEPTAHQDFLQKPFTSRNLLQRVRALLN